MSETSSSTKNELWRSKLGTDYPKAFMEKNEQRLFKELQVIRDLPENRVCVDCGVRGTVWASVNLGVFLCMTCGAHHRSLGTHISKPKGATGTYWWGPDEVAHMKSHGNARAEEIYGSNIPPSGLSKNDATKWKQYLTDKYVHKKYAPPARARTTRATQSSIITKTPPPSPTKFSPRSAKTAKFTNLPMPDIDLIHFDSLNRNSTIVTSSSNNSNHNKSSPAVRSTNVPTDFFADFGL